MVMATYTGTQQAEAGLYFRTSKRFSVIHLDDAGPLPGTAADTYHRVPTLVALLTAPLAGLAFVVFIPFIGIAMALYLLGDLALQAARNALTEGVRVARPGWAPSLAFLSRSKPAKPETNAKATPDAWKDDVEKKLNTPDRDEP
jgi:hypothetical protein